MHFCHYLASACKCHTDVTSSLARNLNFNCLFVGLCTAFLFQLENDIQITLHEALPKCSKENCNFNTIINCENEEESRQEEETNIIKRDTEAQQRKRKAKKRKKINIKFNIKAEYDKEAVLNGTVLQKNLQKRLKHRNFIEPNATITLQNPKYGCPVGYIVRKNKCGMFLQRN